MDGVGLVSPGDSSAPLHRSIRSDPIHGVRGGDDDEEDDHAEELGRGGVRGGGGGGHGVADDPPHDRGRLRRERDPPPNVTSKILSKVIEYCKKHVDAAAKPSDEAGAAAAAAAAAAGGVGGKASAVPEDDLKAWDAEFVKVDQTTLFDLILAANYLNIKGLLDLTCQTVADMIKGKTPEEIRKTFNIKNDFTPEEEEEIRRENQWAFE
uniref:SKP1-like protein n=1 Tax=Ananas comosus var. bracteatus TaxID=296719 RepID=A0A6V7NK74_ANACO|nr:unnamed protein product [Ananas comosus var. bracteatus]